jgi:ATP-dependent RNA helicase RhlE
MHHSDSYERRGRGPRPPFRRRRNRHPGLAEHEPPRQPPKPKGEIPAAFAETVFGQVNPLLQHAVAEEGYLTPTPIQEKAIPHLLEGRDLLGCAQTGTGKTAAFLLPILHRLALNPKPTERNPPRALILAPTRELAAQIADSTAGYGKFLGLPFAVVFGGVSQFPQVKALNRGAVLVVATPGRLLDLMEQGHLTLDGIEEFVLDEADRMLDMGFLPDIKRILSHLPEQRHTQFFSATLSPEILRLAMSIVKDPVHVTISPDQPTVDKINQSVMFVEKADKAGLLAKLLTDRPELAKVIVFARTRHGSDKIVRKLEDAGIRADAIHSDKTQRARTNTLEAFRNGRVRVLVATDIASRGIDVDGITHVINFDLPEETESYIHRIGRTARAVERMIRKDIPIDRAHDFHSERAERAAGKGVSEAPPPWVKNRAGRTDGRPGRDDRRSRPPSHKGRGQPDFKRPASDDGPGTPPWELPEESGERPPRREARPPRHEEARPPRRERREGEAPAPRQDDNDRWYAKPFKKHLHRPEPDGERGRPSYDQKKRPANAGRGFGPDREQPPRFDEADRKSVV